MADDIRQNIGIDVSQAVAAVDRLQKKLSGLGRTTSNLATKLGNFNRTASGAFRGLGGATTSISKANKALDQLGFGGGAAAKGMADVAAAQETVTSSSKQAANSMIASGKATTSAGTAAATAAGKTTGAMSRLGRSIRIQGRAAAIQMKRLGLSFRRMGQSAAQSISSILPSWRTFVRIIATQVIIRSLNALMQAFRSAISGAMDFQQSVAEVRSIAEGSLATFDGAAEAVRRLSDAFNLPLGDVGRGLYQTISNQIQGTANILEVTEQAAMLAKGGFAELEQTVLLLTGTINAFELQAREADRISAIFFKTVEKGRTTIRELAQHFGQVATMFAAAGGQVDELSAAFATLTINGISTAKAATQLRGIVNAFLKPTEDMAEALNRAGYSTGALFLEAEGLVGAMQFLNRETGGNAQAMAKLIPRIRGLGGALVLSRKDAEQLDKTLGDVRSSARDLAAEKYEMRLETPAEQIEVQITRLANALKVDFGGAIVTATAEVLNFVNYMGVAEAAIRFVIPVIGALGVACVITAFKLGLLAGATGLVASAFAVLQLALAGPIGIFAAIVAGAYGAGKALQALEKRAQEAAVAAARQERAGRTKELYKGINERLKLEKAQIRDRYKRALDVVAREKQILDARLKHYKELHGKIAKDFKKMTDIILSLNKQLLSDLESERDQYAEMEKTAGQNAVDIATEVADENFKTQQRHRSELQKTSKFRERADQLARQGARDLARATTQEAAEAARATLARARGFHEASIAAAEASENASAINRAYQARTRFANQVIRAENQQKALAGTLTQRAKDALATEEERVGELEDSVSALDEIIEKYGEAVAAGDLFKTQDLEAQFQQELAKFKRISLPKGILKPDQLVSVREMARSLEREWRKVSTRKVLEMQLSGKSINNLQSQVANAITLGLTNALRVAAPEMGKEFFKSFAAVGPEAFEQMQQGLVDERKIQWQIADNRAAIAEKEAEIAEAIKDAAVRMDEAAGSWRETLAGMAGVVVRAAQAVGIKKPDEEGEFLSTKEAAAQLEEMHQDFARLGPLMVWMSTEDAQKTLASFRERYNEWEDQIDDVTRGHLFARRAAYEESVGKIVTSLVQGFEQGTAGAENIDSALKGTKAVTDGVQQDIKSAADSAKNLQNSAGDAQTSTSTMSSAMGSIASTSGTAATNYERMASAAERVAQAGGGQMAATGGFIQGFQHGGIAHFARGGATGPQGTDTIPAWLSPGEFVVNAKSTRKFFSQLQAINSGIQPIYRQEGGPVTNVGDINVSVSADTRNADATGRKIVRSIRRELRRNTSQL